LFPVSEQQYLAQQIPGARFVEIDSFYGHDGFLIETKKLACVISSFYREQGRTNNHYQHSTILN
jgi:homoserine O-acetyltransferase